MTVFIPPQPPRPLALEDGDGLHRFQFRLWLISLSLATVLITVWLFVLDPFLGILGAVTAKHILVAVLLSRLEVNRSGRPER